MKLLGDKRYNLVIILLFSFMGLKPTHIYAHDFENDGIYYNIIDGNAEVTFRGDSYYFANSYSGSLNIPPNVTYNGVTYSVTSIGDYAFYNCESLTTVTFPKSMTSIGSNVFFGCSSLIDITVDETNPYFSSYEGMLCNKSMSKLLRVPNGIIGSLKIPEGIKSIEAAALQNCINITSVFIPEGLVSIGALAFNNCSSLSTVSLPNSITSIGDYAFYRCSSLISINLPNSITSIGEYAFKSCSSLTSITIPNSITDLRRETFSFCSSLTHVSLPYSLTSIAPLTFAYCNSLTLSLLPESIEFIGEYAFFCTALKTFFISGNINYIGIGAFADCTSLNEINVSADNQKYCILNGFLYDKSNNQIICAPAGIRGEIIIPEGITSIPNYAFSGCSSLTSILIPNSVTSIGDCALSGCTQLTSISIPNSVKSIGRSAFTGCSSLVSIKLPDGITSVECFSDCTSLTSIELPASLISIGDYCFSGCTALLSIYLPNSVTSIGSYAFQNCTSLNSISFPTRATNIGDCAFYNCFSLKSASLPDGITSIKRYTFANCTSLNSITIPSSVNSIDNYGIANCRSLTSVWCHAPNVPTLSIDAFYVNNINKTLYVPSGSINDYKISDWAKWFNDIKPIETSAICNPPADSRKISFRSNGNEVEFTGLESNETISIYNTSGMLVYQGQSHTVTLNPNSVYILRTTHETIKFSF